MRQEAEYEFISLLNKIWVGAVDYKVEKLLKPRFVTKDDLFYPKHASYMFAENSPIVDYNELMLNEIVGQTISLSATDDTPHETVRRTVGNNQGKKAWRHWKFTKCYKA